MFFKEKQIPANMVERVNEILKHQLGLKNVFKNLCWCLWRDNIRYTYAEIIPVNPKTVVGIERESVIQGSI